MVRRREGGPRLGGPPPAKVLEDRPGRVVSRRPGDPPRPDARPRRTGTGPRWACDTGHRPGRVGGHTVGGSSSPRRRCVRRSTRTAPRGPKGSGPPCPRAPSAGSGCAARARRGPVLRVPYAGPPTSPSRVDRVRTARGWRGCASRLAPAPGPRRSGSRRRVRASWTGLRASRRRRSARCTPGRARPEGAAGKEPSILPGRVRDARGNPQEGRSPPQASP